MESRNKIKPSSQNTMEIEDIIEGLEMLKGRLIRASQAAQDAGDSARRATIVCDKLNLEVIIMDLKRIDRHLPPWEG